MSNFIRAINYHCQVPNMGTTKTDTNSIFLTLVIFIVIAQLTLKVCVLCPVLKKPYVVTLKQFLLIIVECVRSGDMLLTM